MKPPPPGPATNGMVTPSALAVATAASTALPPCLSTSMPAWLAPTATCYEPAGPTGADGYWQVTPAGQAPFATRLVVCRPSDPGAFTGTVILEWLNVSAGFDAPAHWMLTHRQVIRAGWAWVGVSAQRAGIEGGSIFDTAGEEPDSGSRRAMVLPALKESD